MLSRVAQSMYWISRYLERAENYARFISVNLNLSLDLPEGLTEQWEPLVRATGDWEQFSSRYEAPSRDSVLYFMTFDTENPNSILSCLSMARENARTVREMLSTEMWEHVNHFYLEVKGNFTQENVMENPDLFYAKIRRQGHLAGGILDSTMSHSEGWHFSNLGRFIERADKTARILDIKYFILLPDVSAVGSPIDLLQWTAVLKSASAFEMYRKKYGVILPARIVEFLLLDREFPRSILFCLARAENSLHEISGSRIWSFVNPAEKLLGKLRSDLDYTDIRDIFNQGLHEYIDLLQFRMNEIDQSLYETFFDPGIFEPSPRTNITDKGESQ